MPFDHAGYVPSPTRAPMRGLGPRIAAFWRAWRTRSQLLQLDDRMLQDLGISRAQAQFEAQRWPRHGQIDR